MGTFFRDLVGVLIGIVAGGLISWYFYIKGEKAGQISTTVEQVQVFDKSRAGPVPLRVLDAQGNEIKDNVFAASIVILNSGNAEIRKTDVRKPYRIRIADDVQPLDLTVSAYTNDNVNKFYVSPTGHLSWEHFDPREGLKVRLLYVSPVLQTVFLEGSALGVGPILIDTQKQPASWQLWVLWPCMIGLIILASYLTWSTYPYEARAVKYGVIFIWVLAFSQVVNLFVFYLHYISYQPAPLT